MRDLSVNTGYKSPVCIGHVVCLRLRVVVVNAIERHAVGDGDSGVGWVAVVSERLAIVGPGIIVA